MGPEHLPLFIMIATPLALAVAVLANGIILAIVDRPRSIVRPRRGHRDIP